MKRCRNRKSVKVLNAPAKLASPKTAERLSTMMFAGSRSGCECGWKEFILQFKKSYHENSATLTCDSERRVAFLDYPREHRIHLGTINIVKLPFKAVRI